VLFLFQESYKRSHDGAYSGVLRDYPNLERLYDMKVIVRDNQIEKAIKDLKRKLTKEGFFSEIKERRFYDKPSVQKKKKQAKAAKRRRKRVKRF
jgi:small subunit ribosomal protein S21